MELNRPPLLEARDRRIDSLGMLLDRYATAANATIKEALLSQVKAKIADDKEYSFCLRSFFDQMANP